MFSLFKHGFQMMYWFLRFFGRLFYCFCSIGPFFGSHGGVLVGVSNDVNLNITDVSISDYEFSLACVVVDVKPICFVRIYFPPSTSDYSVDCEILTSCLHAKITKFASMSCQCGFGVEQFYLHSQRFHFSLNGLVNCNIFKYHWAKVSGNFWPVSSFSVKLPL